MTEDATAESKAELESNFAKAAIEEKLAQVKHTTSTATATGVTVSSIGRRLPPKPAWWKSDEEATMANQLAAAALSEVPGGKK